MDQIFRALANETRRKVIDELLERDGQTLFELCSRLLMQHKISSSRQAISQHLEILEEANLISVKWDGKYKFHYINVKPILTILERWKEKIEDEEE